MVSVVVVVVRVRWACQVVVLVAALCLVAVVLGAPVKAAEMSAKVMEAVGRLLARAAGVAGWQEVRKVAALFQVGAALAVVAAAVVVVGWRRGTALCPPHR